MKAKALSRRKFIQSAIATAALLGNPAPGFTADVPHPKPSSRPVPMIHVTDLFRPHDDPDDHWDLACVYALAFQGRVDLRGILIDYPKPERRNDPDVLAVAQMNHLTGKAVPVMVGSSQWIENPRAITPENEGHVRGIRALLDLMRHSPEPVVINILGSCRDIALASKMEPELFTTKCRAVYLNAGSGTRDAAKAAQLEWNVRLDPRGYSALFDLPCPIYWMPCFEIVEPRPKDLFQVAEYGTFYRFHQGDVLPQLSESLQRFFDYTFLHGRFIPKELRGDVLRPDWLQTLTTAANPALRERVRAMDRNMWCTGGFLHAAGLSVAKDGQIVPLENVREPVFTFDPIEVSCSPDGITRWSESPQSKQRFLFHVRDKEHYPSAMTAALRSMLGSLP